MTTGRIPNFSFATFVQNDTNLEPIPYGRQHITKEDLAAVNEVLQSNYLTQGPEIQKFEEAFAKYVGAEYAVAVANGTAALHLCALSLNIQPGQKVITTPITFAASANCVRYCGGEVIFADIDPNTYLIDINAVHQLLEASPQGTYAGIIPVDFAGRAVNLEAFRQLADEYKLWIIEDACHAPGGYFMDSSGRQQTCGNGRFADLAIFSFHPVKHIAAGEGGMVTTNNKALYEKLLVLRTHGITKNEESYKNSPQLATGASHISNLKSQIYPSWYMEMQSLGYNYRLTDMQAALGSSQLQRADAGLKRRREIAARYAEAFEGLEAVRDVNYEVNGGTVNGERRNGGTVNGERRNGGTVNGGTVNGERRNGLPTEGHAYHLYVIEAENRLGLYNHLRQQKIFAQIHYIPLHLMPYYRDQGWSPGDFPKAERYYERCISLPMFPTLTEEQQNYVIEQVTGFYRGQ